MKLSAQSTVHYSDMEISSVPGENIETHRLTKKDRARILCGKCGKAPADVCTHPKTGAPFFYWCDPCFAEDQARQQRQNRTMKKFMICLTVPSLPAAHAQQTAEGDGSTLRIAINDALTKILTRPCMKGRQLRHGRLSFSLIEQAEQEGE